MRPADRQLRHQPLLVWAIYVWASKKKKKKAFHHAFLAWSLRYMGHYYVGIKKFTKIKKHWVEKLELSTSGSLYKAMRPTR